jgi:predicted acetyltransferase
MSKNSKHFIKIASIKEKPLLENLLQSYLDELSKYPGENLSRNSNGFYPYIYLDYYWKDDDRYPYLLFSDNEITGFAMVRKADTNWEMAEFYVLPEYRRKGSGLTYACEILGRHPGDWIIEYNEENATGSRLWNKLAVEKAVSGIEYGQSENGHLYLKFNTQIVPVKN